MDPTLPILSADKISFTIEDLRPEIQHELRAPIRVQEFTGPSPVAPLTIGAWYCPRCNLAFHPVDQARHVCFPNPAHWHHVDGEGRIRHAPNYDNTFAYGTDPGCGRCVAAASEYRFHLEARPSTEYAGLTTIWAVSIHHDEADVPLVDLEEEAVPAYLNSHHADTLVAHLRA